MRRAGQHGSKRGSGGGCSRARSSSRPLSVQSPSSARGACPELGLWHSAGQLDVSDATKPTETPREAEADHVPSPCSLLPHFPCSAWHGPLLPTWLAPAGWATGLAPIRAADDGTSPYALCCYRCATPLYLSSQICCWRYLTSQTLSVFPVPSFALSLNSSPSPIPFWTFSSLAPVLLLFLLPLGCQLAYSGGSRSSVSQIRAA